MLTVAPLLLMLAIMAPTAGQPIPQGEQSWLLTLDDPSAIVFDAWSPTGTCLVVATDTTVHVIDRAGRPLWTWNFRETNRLIRVTHLLAVSPACDAVAIGGGVDYRYIWTAAQGGKHAFFKTTGTPEAVKFSLRGDVLAVSTAASIGYLLSAQLALRWSGSLGDLPVKWPSQVLETSGVQPLEFAKDDLDQLFNVAGRYQDEEDSVSDDGQWRVVSRLTRRSDDATIELWGPGAEGYRERYRFGRSRPPRWTKPIGCPGATITRDGMFVVVNGDLYPKFDGAGRDEKCETGGLPTYVFDRDGNTVVTWPDSPPDNGAEMSRAVVARTGRGLVLAPTRPSWDVSSLPEEVSTHKSSRRTFSPDGSMLLVARDHNVRVYRAPR